MKRICIHWTAGTYKASDFDKLHYHRLVDGDGVIHQGKHKPEANIPPLKNGFYAAHCGGGNSYTIGWALCGMAGYKSPAKVGSFPLNRSQCEAAWKGIAEDCHKYGIPVSPSTVYTHAEFGRANPQSDSAGKIDIVYLPYKPELLALEIGDYIRGKVQWYLKELQNAPRNP